MVNKKIQKWVVAGILSAVVFVLFITQLDFILLPPPFPSVTTLHIPVIIGSILEGPLVGIFIGLVFGIASIAKAAMIGQNVFDLAVLNFPVIAIIPRILIGPAAWALYTLIMRRRGALDAGPKYTPQSITLESAAIVLAAIVGSLVNTVLYLSGLVIFLEEATWHMALAAGIANGPVEAILAAIVTLSVVSAWKHIPRHGGRSKLRREAEK